MLSVDRYGGSVVLALFNQSITHSAQLNATWREISNTARATSQARAVRARIMTRV